MGILQTTGARQAEWAKVKTFHRFCISVSALSPPPLLVNQDLLPNVRPESILPWMSLTLRAVPNQRPEATEHGFIALFSYLSGIGSSKKLKRELPYGPAIPLPGIYPKHLKPETQSDVCTTLFTAALLAIAKRWK